MKSIKFTSGGREPRNKTDPVTVLKSTIQEEKLGRLQEPGVLANKIKTLRGRQDLFDVVRCQ